MKVGNFDLDIKNIIAISSVLFAVFSYIGSVKNDIVLLKKDMQDIKEEKLKDINLKIDDKMQNILDDFSEYKIRNNNKIDDLNKKIYEMNAQVQVCEKLSKKNSRFMDAQINNMISKK